MTIQDLKVGDLIEFKSGKKKTINMNDFIILKQFYDDELNCTTNDDYTIISIYRPFYETIYSREIFSKSR